MLKIRTKGHRSKLKKMGSDRSSFYSPPTEMLFDCEQPKGIPLATGAIIDPSVKRRQITTRRGPIVIGMPTPTKREKYKLVPRNEFLPERQVSYSQPLYPHRLSEEDREAARLADIARNGALVQISNKTLDSIYEKFDLFTIGDDILKKVRTGQMSKKDARASAMLSLSREIKSAFAQGKKSDAIKLLTKIKSADKTLFPTLSTIGSTPGETAASPVLDLAALNSVMPNADAATFIALTELLRDGKILYNSETDLVDGVIPFDVLANTTMEELQLAFDMTENDADMVEDRKLYKKILDHHKGVSAPTTQVMGDEGKHDVTEEKATGKPVELQEPAQFPTGILEDPPTLRKTRQERTTDFFTTQSAQEAEFIEQITTYIDELVRDLENIVADIDVATSSPSTDNKILVTQTRQKEIQKKISSMVVQLKQDKVTLPDVQGEINRLLSELGGMIQNLADDMGEEQTKSVDIVPPPPPPPAGAPESSLMAELVKGKTLKKVGPPAPPKPSTATSSPLIEEIKKKGTKALKPASRRPTIVKPSEVPSSSPESVAAQAAAIVAERRASTMTLADKIKLAEPVYEEIITLDEELEALKPGRRRRKDPREMFREGDVRQLKIYRTSVKKQLATARR